MFEFACENCGKITPVLSSVRVFVCGCKAGAGSIRISPHSQRPESHWIPLHQYAVDHADDWDESAAREFYQGWYARIPGVGCRSCLAKWDTYTVANPPDFSSAKSFALWGFVAHNYVSEYHAGKPTVAIDDCWLAYWPKPRRYCDGAFVAVTSLAPRKCHRQTAALNSWVDFGLTVHAVNTAAEIETLRMLYPQVDHWHASEEQSQDFSKRTATINSLIDMAIRLDRTVLVINSDCETYGNPNLVSSFLADKTLVFGIRYNYIGNRHFSPAREEWGLDCFVVTPEMAATVPRLGLGIGSPVWDYWIPLHFQSRGYSVVTPEHAWLFHRSHPLAWNQDDWLSGARIVQEHYGYPMRERSRDFRESLPFPPSRIE